MEIEKEQKADKIKVLMTSCLGVPDERIEEREMRIAELEDKVELLEKDNFRLKQDTSSKTAFGKPGAAAQGGKSEPDQLIKDLSKQNAVLRRKLDDALEKLIKYEK